MMRFLTQPGRIAILVAAVAILALAIWGCSDAPQSPTASNDNSESTFSMANPRFSPIRVAQERHTRDLMADPEVIGTAITLGDDGEPVILLLVTSDRAFRAAPRTLDGFKTKVEITDKIVALGKPGGGGGVSHTAKQTPPVKMGTSGGWRYDFANGYCCGGTMGSLINVGSQKRILSNYHVFEADIVNGGNSRQAQTGDFVIQPALIDVGCNAANAQNVATLVVSHKLPNTNVDASTATVIPGMVDETGNILEVGTISAQTVGASIGQAVKKSGRTSGLTRSTVYALNATITVSYENECAGGTAFTKTFTGQIVLSGGKFIQSGDSGSLMVEDVTTNPRAVGLCFAGSRFYGYANPINEVLGEFNATMVGQ